MTWLIHESSNPYVASIETRADDEGVIIRMAVDQLWVDPDTDEQEVLTEYYEKEEA